jgi:DNA polymerase-1
LVLAELADWALQASTAKGGRPTKLLALKPVPTPDKTDTTSDQDTEEDSMILTQPQGDLPPNQEKPRELDGSVSFVRCQNGTIQTKSDTSPERNPEVQEEVVSGFEQSGESASYLLIDTTENLSVVLQALDETDLVGLDLETTGLNNLSDRIRLLSLATDRGLFLVDCFLVDPVPLFEALAEKTLVGHNLQFDLGFLNRLGFVPGAVHCTMLLSQVLYAGNHLSHKLADCVERELRQSLDKTEQLSDWSKDLTSQQLKYASRDVAVLVPLFQALSKKIKDAGLVEAGSLESRCLPALTWLANSGVGFDRNSWEALTAEATTEAAKARLDLDSAVPNDPEWLFQDINWDSPEQVQRVFALVGCRLADTSDRSLAAVEHPLGTFLRRYRAARKRVSTYGRDWLKLVGADERIYAGWVQIGATSGRMACRRPNLQNLPRDPRYRKCFVASPGKVLIKADYSQIELRIAAKVSGDKALLEAYQRGDDLHTLTAKIVLNKEEVTKDNRQLAKALNFGLLYGMGHRGFRIYARSHYNLDLSEEQAKKYRSAFFSAYPGLAQWHRKVRNDRALETRTLIGRCLTLTSNTPDTLRLNTPIQGTGADGLKNALALLWERRAECPGAIPLLVVHDEIVIEVDKDKTEPATAWLKKAMLDGFGDCLDPVPVEVEVQAGPTWGG